MTYPKVRDNSPKGLLIPHVDLFSHEIMSKDLSLRDGLAAYQLVGGVTAYQGDDG